MSNQCVVIPVGSSLVVSPGTTLTLGNGSKFTTTTSASVSIETDKEIGINLPPRKTTIGGRVTRRKTQSLKRKSRRNKRYIV
jgi:hypothetical protein